MRKWLRLLPHPFTRAGRKAAYCYDISILTELLLTQGARPAGARPSVLRASHPRRLLEVERLSHDRMLAEDTFHHQTIIDDLKEIATLLGGQR